MSLKRSAAFFDLDGTLTRKDTFLEFLKSSKGNVYFFICLLCCSPFIVLFYAGLFSNYRLKEKFFSFYFKNKPKDEVLQLGKEFSEKILPNLILPEGLKMLSWHKKENHEIYILTASSDIWLEEWCDENDLNLICTHFQVLNNKLTGRIDGRNCYGKEKVNRIENLLSKYEKTYGYGDSTADEHFLNLMDFSHKHSFGKGKNSRIYLSLIDSYQVSI